MPVTKYKRYFQEMLKQNQKLFGEFEQIHEKYQKREISQEEYNRLGSKALEKVKEWESKLCLHMESGKYGNYSAQLAEKFRDEVRKKFPLIDFIGVEVEKV